MKRLLLFFLTAVSAAAQGPPQVLLRVVTFEKAGAATSLAAAEPDSDESLYTALAAEAAAGSAVRVLDQAMTVRGGQRSRVMAFSEYPFLTGGIPYLSTWAFEPRHFQHRVLGNILEAEVTVGEQTSGMPAHPLDINVAADCPSLLMQRSRPVPDFRGAGQMGSILRPVFGLHQVSGRVIAWTGRTHLIGISPGSSAPLLEKGPLPFRYTFLRAALDGEKPLSVKASLPHEGSIPRFHALTFRLPRREALALLEGAAGDGELYSAVQQRVKQGTAELVDHSAIITPGKVSYGAELVHEPECSDLVPREWKMAHIGGSMEAKARQAAWQIAILQSSRPEYTPLHPSSKHPALHTDLLEYDERELSTTAAIGPAGIRYAAITASIPAADDAAEEYTEITFLRTAPSGSDSASAHMRLEALVLSLPAGAGPAAKPGSSAVPLLRALSEQSIYCLSHAGLALSDGIPGKVRAGRSIAGAAGATKAAVDDEVMLPDGFDRALCGVSLEAHARKEGTGFTAEGSLTWDTAPPLNFGGPGAPLPKATERRVCSQFQFQNVTLTSGQPIVAEVRPSNAPAGSAEHNRRHAVVLRLTAQ